MKRLFFLLLWLVSAFAQAQQTVRGRIAADSAGTGIEYAEVSISELGMLTLSDKEGNFVFKKVPGGAYTLFIDHPLFKPKTISFVVADSTNLAPVIMKKDSRYVDEVVVYGSSSADLYKTANDISVLETDDARNSGALNISDAMAKMPGVSQLSTGPGISKPVIRGLFGNRIQTLLYGLRFDNQQWQDEHGLGLSDVGVDRIEIIKGPASLLYGSEAMGGVVNILEEKNAPIGKISSDFSARAFSNTFGYATDIGVKGTHERFNWRIRSGTDSHADYTDGKNSRILNSRFGGYYGKGGFGYTGNKWINQNNYFFAQNNFGFIMDPVQLKDPADDRMSRSFDRPHHTVNLHMISSQNTFFLPSSKIRFNAGYQSNNRQEQEGGSRVSLDMLLNTALANLTWIIQKGKTEWSVGSQGFYQTNTNNGSRTIIPDAIQSEASLFVYSKTESGPLVFEGGIRGDYKSIQTFSTGLINTDTTTPGHNIKPFNNRYGAMNGSLGFSWFNKRNICVKTNLSSGYRSANLAELSSNGLHEGSIRYEIGNPDLKTEQNACGDVVLQLFNEYVQLTLSVWHNQFFNYIYLAPFSEEYLGFRIYYYRQRDAAMEGTESSLLIKPTGKENIVLSNSFSYIYGYSGNEYLPFIPAPKLNSEIQLNKKGSGTIQDFSFRPGITYVFPQDRPGDFETSSVDYLLLNASVSCSMRVKGASLAVGLSGNNLLNHAYADHLSRYKYYGILNTGRNISLNFKIKFT